ncbi:MAG: hypothetical protein ABWY19_16395, partial [Marmoricola sp.]
MALFRRRTTPRPPVADLEHASVEVGGRTLALSEVLVAARVEGGGLSVIVHHPALADLLDEPRLLAAHEILVAALGEDGLRRTVVQVSPANHPPIDPFSLES